jgi:hypothetical protein
VIETVALLLVLNLAHTSATNAQQRKLATIILTAESTRAALRDRKRCNFLEQQAMVVFFLCGLLGTCTGHRGAKLMLL